MRYAAPGAKTNRTTRVQASTALQQQFERLKVDPRAIVQVPTECIIIKDGNPEDRDTARPIEYEDTDETHRMRGVVEAYNALLAQTYIDIPTLDDPWITRYNALGKEIRVRIGPRSQQVRRIFSRGSWTMNGRFYGPWWQGLGSELRSQIFINDTPTVEIDFKAMHLHILAARDGREVPDDPYHLPPGQFPGVRQEEQRGLVKLLVLMALNAKDVPSACSAFREGLDHGHPGKRLKNVELEKVLDDVKQQIPWLGDSLCSDAGVGLMFFDSRIIERVIEHYTGIGVPVLTIHDSIIVPYTHSKQACEVMRQAAIEVVGREIPLEAEFRGIEEFEHLPIYIQQDFWWWRETERCQGYLTRLEEWEETTGREVIPFPVHLVGQEKGIQV